MNWDSTTWVWLALAAVLLYFLPALLAFTRLMRARGSNPLRAVWVVVILIFPFFGSLAYLFLGDKSGNAHPSH